MNHFFSILLTAILCATASAQTIKTLGYNTNGQVVANTATNVSLTFTNDVVKFATGDLSISNQSIVGTGVSFSFEDGSFDAGATIVRENLGFSTNLNTLWTATNASNARSAVGLGATWLTNTNVTNFRTAVGLGATNNSFSQIGGANTNEYINLDNAEFYGGPWTFDQGFALNGDVAAATTRTNLGIPLAALTNTSNVTMMRALAGSTNTNQPFSGTITFQDFSDNTHTVSISNGVVISYTGP